MGVNRGEVGAWPFFAVQAFGFAMLRHGRWWGVASRRRMGRRDSHGCGVSGLALGLQPLFFEGLCFEQVSAGVIFTLSCGA